MVRILGIFVLAGFVFLSGCKEKTKLTTSPANNNTEGEKGKTPPEGNNNEGENGKTPPGENGSKPAGAGALTPENTKIEWTGTKPEGKHDGGFKQFSGSIKPIDGDFTASTITLEIDTDSLYSDNKKLTGHLKSPDFFDVKKYPNASFTSTAIKKSKSGNQTHEITGKLNLHGTEKSITFPAKVSQTDDTITVDTTFTFDRTEYGISFSPNKVDKMVTVKVSSKLSRK